MIAAILAFFIIWEVIAIFYYKSKGEEEKAEKSIKLTAWFVLHWWQCWSLAPCSPRA